MDVERGILFAPDEQRRGFDAAIADVDGALMTQQRAVIIDHGGDRAGALRRFGVDIEDLFAKIFLADGHVPERFTDRLRIAAQQRPFG